MARAPSPVRPTSQPPRRDGNSPTGGTAQEEKPGVGTDKEQRHEDTAAVPPTPVLVPPRPLFAGAGGTRPTIRVEEERIALAVDEKQETDI